MTDAPERIWTNGRPGGHWSEGIPGAGDCPVFYLRADAVEARLAAAEKMAEALKRLADCAESLGEVCNNSMCEDACDDARAALTAWEAAKGEK